MSISHEEYRARLAELDSRGEKSLSELRAQSLALAKNSVQLGLETGLIQAGILRDAARDTATLILQGLTFDEKMRPTLDGRVVNLRELAGDYLSRRPWLKQQDNTASTSANGSSTWAGPWDISRAIKDLAYDKEWQAKDPEGRVKAWDAYIANLDETQRRARRAIPDDRGKKK